ncbi:DUF2129 domain-containing protein [Mycoplasmatota bacterium WC30]
MVDRKGIVIYFQNKRVLKAIKKMNVHIAYVNDAGKYLAGYCDTEEFQAIKKELKKHRLVKKVDESLIEMPDIGL